MNIIANHLAIVIDVPAINPKPNNAATNATIKNIIAHPSNE